MAVVTKGGTLPDTGVTKNEVYALVDSATVSGIVNADVDASAAIVDTKLATISTAGKVSGAALTTLTAIPAAAGAIPAANLANVGGSKDNITRGFELLYNNTTTVIVQAGTLYHGNTQINATANTTLTLATAGDWYDAATHSYSGGAGWCYIGVDSSGNIKLLGANPPDKADTAGNTAGTLYYWYYSGGAKYYRVVGAIRVTTADAVAYKWYQNAGVIYYDDPVEVTSTVSMAAWSGAVSCAAGMPAITRFGLFSVKIIENTTDEWGFAIRPNGGATTDITTSGCAFEGYGNDTLYIGSFPCATDTAQQIQHYETATFVDTLSIRVAGFHLNIR